MIIGKEGGVSHYSYLVVFSPKEFRIQNSPEFSLNSGQKLHPDFFQ